ncbi:unnamed protein product, partial [Closterium sp. NIES-53]
VLVGALVGAWSPAGNAVAQQACLLTLALLHLLFLLFLQHPITILRSPPLLSIPSTCPTAVHRTRATGGGGGELGRGGGAVRMCAGHGH